MAGEAALAATPEAAGLGALNGWSWATSCGESVSLGWSSTTFLSWPTPFAMSPSERYW